MVDGYLRLERNKHNNIMSLAWHSAAFERMERMPKLNDLLIKEEAVITTPQSTETMIATCKMLNAAYGGSEIAV